MFKIFLFLFSFTSCIYCAVIEDKVLICGICRNIEKSFLNSALSATKLGEQFLDYTIIFYENNSQDKTKYLLKAWEKTNPHVLILSEDLSLEELCSSFEMKIYNRIEAIARARNQVLDRAMQERYADYRYVIWADLDFLEPWDIKEIVETILHPEQEWDAVFANGSYDLFAFRDAQFPIGFELLGNRYWSCIEEIRSRFYLDPSQGWRKVYSAFGGLGIYKREALQGCRYSGIISKDLEEAVISWLTAPSVSAETPLLNHYLQLLSSAPVLRLDAPLFYERHLFPLETGVKLNNGHAEGKITWFCCTPGTTLPFTCEHVLFHAAMAAKGHNRLFINPKLISNHPKNEELK